MLSSEIYTNTTTSATAATGAAATTAATTSTTTTATTLQLLKPRKRRKRRKRAGHAISNTTTTTNSNNINVANTPNTSVNTSTPISNTSATHGRKCKAQYFQHDNREYITKYESFQFTAQTSAAALNYAAVAKKFKPLRPALASGANKARRPAINRKLTNDCACACQTASVTQCPQEIEPRTAVDVVNSNQRELGTTSLLLGNQSKINIDGKVLLELIKHSSHTLLETLLGAGSGMGASVRETHQIAEAQQQKNAKLREAFNISEYFVEGSSFDSDRKAKEDLAKGVALQKELDAQRESLAAAAAAAGKDKDTGKRYALVRTPSREREGAGEGKDKEAGGAITSNDEREHVSKSDKKKKKKRNRESSASPERKKDKKKKSKKHKKESKSKKKKSRKRKHSASDSGDSDKDSDDEEASSDEERELKSARKKAKKDKVCKG